MRTSPAKRHERLRAKFSPTPRLSPVLELKWRVQQQELTPALRKQPGAAAQEE
jgi:hypothetical protein